MTLPFVSVIVLNYNGRQYLTDCLSALQRQIYPADRFEVVLVDNASTDGSVEFVRRMFPNVRVIENKVNLGFAGGNNAGIRATDGEYVALLNNDTAAEPDWLSALVEACQSDPAIGACTSKLLFFCDRLPLQIATDTFQPQGDGRELGLQVHRVDTGHRRGKVEYLEGFYSEEVGDQGRFRWTAERAVMGLPVLSRAENLVVDLTLAAPRPADGPVGVSFQVNGQQVADGTLQGREPVTRRVVVSRHLLAAAKPIIQNAGSIVFTDGSGRDRGTHVRHQQQYHEEDQGQYDQVEEVFAACGASVLYRRTMLQDVGLFDEDFFMYYEDTDLAWRARLRGWKILYVPDSVVRHVHCGTATEWSPFFIYHVDRNRLAMLFKNGTARQVARAWARYWLSTGLTGLRTVRSLILRREDQAFVASRFGLQVRVCGTLARWLPHLWRKRRSTQRSRTVPQSAIDRWMVEQ